MKNQLIGIGYSPWTQKARWALEHHRIEYGYSEHLIMVGKPLLRLRTGRLRGDVTAPALLTAEGNHLDSFDIARFADRLGGSTSLFPKAHTDEIERWNDLSNSILCAGRMLTTEAICDNREALCEAIPTLLKPIPGSVPLAKEAARYVLRTYGMPGNAATWLEDMRAGFQKIREALAGKDYLFNEFSIGDIILAVTTQVIQPPDSQYVPLGPESAKCWTRPELVAEFGDLLRWRTGVFEKHGHGYWS